MICFKTSMSGRCVCVCWCGGTEGGDGGAGRGGEGDEMRDGA